MARRQRRELLESCGLAPLHPLIRLGDWVTGWAGAGGRAMMVCATGRRAQVQPAVCCLGCSKPVAQPTTATLHPASAAPVHRSDCAHLPAEPPSVPCGSAGRWAFSSSRFRGALGRLCPSARRQLCPQHLWPAMPKRRASPSTATNIALHLADRRLYHIPNESAVDLRKTMSMRCKMAAIDRSIDAMRRRVVLIE